VKHIAQRFLGFMDAFLIEYPQKLLPVSAEGETPVILYQILLAIETGYSEFSR